MNTENEIASDNNISEEELAERACAGDAEAWSRLAALYYGAVAGTARRYFMEGAETEDMIQEGFIGLCKAVNGFDSGKCPVFRPFALMCIKRQILSALRSASRFKHMPLNTRIPLDAGSEYDEAMIFNISKARSLDDPEAIIISKERVSGIEEAVCRALSENEARVLSLRLEGLSYKEIARITDKDIKSVDNAVQRIKRKLETVFSSAEER